MRKKADMKGSFLQVYLDKIGMKQSLLARELGIYPQTISRWNGDPPNPVKAYLYLRARVSELEARIKELENG